MIVCSEADNQTRFAKDEQVRPAMQRDESGARSAPLCRVGGSNEPAKAGGAAVIDRASGFLVAEACTTRNLAARLGENIGSDEPPKPSRAKQVLGDLSPHPRGGQGIDRTGNAGTGTVRRTR